MSSAGPGTRHRHGSYILTLQMRKLRLEGGLSSTTWYTKSWTCPAPTQGMSEHWLPGRQLQTAVSTASKAGALSQRASLKRRSLKGSQREPQVCADLNSLPTGSSQPGQKACAGPCGQQGVLLMKITAQGVRNLNSGNSVRDLRG